MTRDLVPASEAARALGISLDTLRRWDRSGRIRTERDPANRRLVPTSEIERLAPARPAPPGSGSSARNRLTGVVRAVAVDGALALVEIEVTEPARIVAIVTRGAAEELGLAPGVRATGVVKATTVVVER